MSDVITDSAKFQKGWAGGLPETPCGFGSKLSSTKLQREWIPEVVRRYDIKSIADIGAGDMNWISHVSMPGVKYTAYDLIPRRRDVIEFDLVHEIPPAVDMILCLWVLNHLPYKHCQQAIKNLKASGSKYLMMTDRPRWKDEQPPEINMVYVDELVLNDKQDSIRFIPL